MAIRLVCIRLFLQAFFSISVWLQSTRLWAGKNNLPRCMTINRAKLETQFGFFVLQFCAFKFYYLFHNLHLILCVCLGLNGQAKVKLVSQNISTQNSGPDFLTDDVSELCFSVETIIVWYYQHQIRSTKIYKTISVQFMFNKNWGETTEKVPV